MNSVIHGSESTNAVENVVKSEETKEIDSSKKPTGGNGNSINTVSVQRIDDSEQREKFFLDTINTINNMSFEYEKNNSSSRAVEVVEISADPKSPKQKYNFPIPLFCKNKMTICQKCGEEVNENYLSRRKHVFIRHQDDIKDQLKDLTRLKKTDILFKGFINIHECFPEYAVCSDFQCIECDRYYGSFKGMKYHVGASHQNIIRIKCPFKNCDFKTGGGYQANDHLRTHMKKNGNNKDKVSIRNLASYISAQRYATFKSSCDRGDQMVEKMLNHYFPICVSHYGNFQDDFKKDLSEFKRSYLKPYVLYD
uniref:C2H2-type domain-containing protein n=1 Tax=Strongyloides papillosus TaxID=174720 RepID=A0A0N5BIW1_STREA